MSIRAQGATLSKSSMRSTAHRRRHRHSRRSRAGTRRRQYPSAPGRDVIASLSTASRFNYIVLATDSDPAASATSPQRQRKAAAVPASSSITETPSCRSPRRHAVPSSPEMPIRGAKPKPDPGPQLEPIPEDTSANEAETSPDRSTPPPATGPHPKRPRAPANPHKLSVLKASSKSSG